ncbi:MAG: ABC transporter ATP-binding protein [Actinomycetota bacterium]|nr:ABC transporter ATP-binding protein [Actinomycetota bacterium]MDA3019035.1 ABC transporter ATP-binding protein [Actinomycetota bacterium]
MTLLQVNSLTTGHNGVAVVHDVNLMVESGEVVALLGANGAGKTTLLHTIAGLLPAINGTVFLNDRLVTGLSTHQIVRQGLSLLPENRGIFYQLTVAENLRLYKRQGGAVKVEEVFEYFPALKPLVERKAGLLSGGEQQMLSLGCRFIADPKLMLIDEMSMGLAPIIFQRMLPVLTQFAADRGVGVLLVEQHVHLALKSSSRAYVLNRGELTFSGTANALQNQRQFLESNYMGSTKQRE